MSKKVLVSWSGGKDCSFALYEFTQDDSREIIALLTTLTAGYDRVSMHGVRQALLESQAEALGYPLEKIFIPQQCSDEEYGRLMGTTLQKYRDLGVGSVVFGDLFLEDVRAYREEKLGSVSMSAIFPIWGKDTRELSRAFIGRGFRAIVTCVDTQQLDGEYVGREYDKVFLADLPAGVDPCGENGEFHTFVYDGPIFSRRIKLNRGEKVLGTAVSVFAIYSLTEAPNHVNGGRLVKPKQVFISYDRQQSRPEAWFNYCPYCRTELVSQNIGAAPRPTCPGCGFIQFKNPAPAVSVLIVEGEQVLLGKRAGSPGQGKWALPSGYVEFDDDFLTTGIREVKEEAGLEIEIVEILNVVSSFHSPRFHFLGIYLLACVVGGELQAADDLEAVAWFPLDRPLPVMAFVEDVSTIEMYATGAYEGLLADPDYARSH